MRHLTGLKRRDAETCRSSHNQTHRGRVNVKWLRFGPLVQSLAAIITALLLASLWLPPLGTRVASSGGQNSLVVVDEIRPLVATQPHVVDVTTGPPADGETSRRLTAPASPPLGTSATALFAVDLTHGTELYAQAADLPVPPASTTKIVTAILAVQLLDLEMTVLIQADDLVDTTVYSNMGLAVGDVLSVRSLLSGLMINSGGDAALALARVAGATLGGTSVVEPRARFVQEMNNFAIEAGMNGTTFTNPDGHDEPGHVMTARDLAIATEQLFRYPELERIVSRQTETVEISGANPRSVTLWNTNEFIGNEDVHGVKTGTEVLAGECVVNAFWRDGARIVTVVLGSLDRVYDTQLLIDYLDQEYEWIRIGPGQENTELIEHGLSFATVHNLLLTQAEADALRSEIRLTERAASTRWSRLGEVVFWSEDEPVLRLPVYQGLPSATNPPV